MNPHTTGLQVRIKRILAFAVIDHHIIACDRCGALRQPTSLIFLEACEVSFLAFIRSLHCGRIFWLIIH